MESKTEPKFISAEIQNCFSEIFLQACRDCHNNYSEIMKRVALFLKGTTTHEYDSILNEYQGVTKDLLKMMLFSNFIEINYYRYKSNIPLDTLRLKSIQIVEKKVKSDNILNYIEHKGAALYMAILNDVLIYFNHLSKTFSYNVVTLMKSTGYDKNIYLFYSFARLEHLLTLYENDLTNRDKILGILLDCIILTVERIQFSLKQTPIFNENYKIEIDNILKSNYSIYSEIIQNFKERANLSTDNTSVKKELLEILFLVIEYRSSVGMPLSVFEFNFLKNTPSIMNSLANISNYFTENEDYIMTELIRDWSILIMDNIMRTEVYFPGSNGLNRNKND